MHEGCLLLSSPVVHQTERYFAMSSNDFHQQVYAIVGKIPFGKVVSYGQIAWMLGKPRAAREVGRAMSQCPDNLPWQRVVMGNGAIAGGDHAELRKQLLEAEGVRFLSSGRVDMTACRFDG